MNPQALAGLIAQAQVVLDIHPLGHLPLPNRKAIWRELGPTMTRVIPPLTDGVLRRGALAYLAVQRVLSVWDNSIHTREAEDALIAGRRFVRQQMNRDELSSILKKLWTRADNVMGKGEQFFRASYAARAATNALNAFINDSDYPKNTDRVQEQDEDLDPYDWDTSLYACMALTDDVWADPPARVEERRAFWRWYIQEATPEAYDNFRVILGL